MEINVNGSTHFSLPLDVDGNKIARDAAKLHSPHVLNQRDLEQWERDETTLRGRISHAKEKIAQSDVELKALNDQIDAVEKKVEFCEQQAPRAEVTRALSEHRTRLERLQASLLSWMETRSLNLRLVKAAQTTLDALPWDSIKQLRKERKMLESI